MCFLCLFYYFYICFSLFHYHRELINVKQIKITKFDVLILIDDTQCPCAGRANQTINLSCILTVIVSLLYYMKFGFDY